MNRWRGVHRHALVRRVALFSLSIGLSTLVGLFTIPVLVSNLGAEQWGILAVLQSVSAFFCFVIAFGWGATGPSMVAAVPKSGRRQFYWDSVVTRGILCIVAAPISAVIAAIVTGQSPAVVVLASVAYLAPGLGVAWYYVGTNRPGLLFLFDSLPPILGNIAGLVVVSFVPTLEAFLATMAAFTLAGLVAATATILLRTSGEVRWRRSPREILGIYRSQLPGVTSTVSASLYSSVPTVAVQLFAPQALPIFAISDRLLKYAVLVLAPVLQSIQSWIPEDGPASIAVRARQAVWISFGVGVVGALGLMLFSAPVADLLTHGEAPVAVGLAIIIGIAFLGESVSQVSGLACLVSLGAQRYLATTSVVGALGGTVATLLLTPLAGVWGALAAICGTSLLLGFFRARRSLALAARQQVSD